MTTSLRSSVCAASACVMLLGVARAGGQAPQLPTQVSQTKFDSGQDVVPVYEGWIRNPDGSFDLVFGYFNRNFKEELAIPAGPDNLIEPGGPDRGQPTYFLPRRRARLFRVRVPQDWGQQVLTWTITANGFSIAVSRRRNRRIARGIRSVTSNISPAGLRRKRRS